MDTNALISYLDSHNAEYEEWYKISKEKYLRVAKSLFGSLSNCNTTVLESCKFNSFLRVVRTFLDKSEIFEDWKSVKNLIDFILLNVAVKNEGEQKKITIQLLTLLVDILERTKPIHSKNILDKKRILDTISSILSDDIDIALPILRIIDVVMKMEGVIKYNINNLFQIIIKLFFSKEDVKQLCYLAKIVFYRLSKLEEKTVNPIFRWILNESISYIMKETIDLDTKKEILSLILDLKSMDDSVLNVKYPSFAKDFRNLMLKFMKISDMLWMACKKNHPINCVVQEVFNLIVLQFLIEEGMLNCDEKIVIKEMRLFHVDTDDEQEFPEKYFFFICHMQERHSRLCWSPKTILRAIEDWFYNKRSQIDACIFKSIIFLFPRFALRYSKPKYIAWSNDILKTMMNYPSKSDILTFCQIQLAWILKMGHHSLKIEAIRFWINEVKFHRGLRDALISCQAEKTLLNLIVEDSDKKIGRMASKFLQKIVNKDLSREIAGMLPFVSREPNVFSCFILTRPGVPERMEEKMLLLELVSVMIPSLAEDYVLRAACMYANDLLENMRKEPKCLKAFSKYTSTIEFLLYATYRTEEDVSKEILFLFRNLTSIQVKYHFELEATVETDPMLLLKGSTRQINRVLTIFPIILSAKVDPLLKFKDDTKLNLFYQILDFVDDADKQENALKCLHLLIKNYDWLSFSGAIGSFVKIWCCEQLDVDRSRLYIALIILWLKKLMKHPRHLHPMVPFSEIQNFFMRSGDLNQMNCCSKILRILQQENIRKTENKITLNFFNMRKSQKDYWSFKI